MTLPHGERRGDDREQDQQARHDEHDRHERRRLVEVLRGPSRARRRSRVAARSSASRTDVEARLAGARRRRFVAGPGGGDRRLRVLAPPRVRRRPDGAELVARARELRGRLEPLERAHRGGLLGAAGAVRHEERGVAGEHVPADAGLLVEQRARQSRRGDVRRIDPVGEQLAAVAEPPEREQAGDQPDRRPRAAAARRSGPNHCVTVNRDARVTARGSAMSTSATSSASGPPLRSSARSTTSRTSSSRVARPRAAARRATTSARPSSPSRSVPVADRGRRSRRRCRAAATTPAAAAASAAGQRGVVEDAERRPGRAGRRRRTAPSPSSSGGGWPASRSRAAARSAPSETMQTRGEHVLGVALDERARPAAGARTSVGGHAGEHQRAPGDPQADAERRLVGPVAADVADHRVDGAVGHLDRVEEVAAEQRAAAAGPVVRGELAAPGR